MVSCILANAISAPWRYNEQEEEVSGKFENLYCPGLVKKKEKPFVRDYSDGVVIVNQDGNKSAIPRKVIVMPIGSELVLSSEYPVGPGSIPPQKMTP